MKEIAFCFDLDGTLTKKEILPLIAEEVDLYEEINILTNVTMQGLIPFENSFKLRVKLLSSVPIQKIKQIIDQVPLDKNLQDFILQNNKNSFIVTGNLDVWVDDFIRSKLNCKFYSSTATYEGNNIKSISKIQDKGAVIQELKKEYQKIVVIGDGMNDCAMFKSADHSIAFGGVHEPVESLIQLSDYIAYDSTTLVKLLNNYCNG